MSSVTDGAMPDVEPPPAAPPPDTTEPPRRSLIRRRSAPPRAERTRKPRKRLGAALVRLLKRLWIPLVITAVIAAGGLTVSRLHGLFGSERSEPYGDTRTEAAKPFNPKLLRYEVFGPSGTTADISYFDGNGEPQYLKGAVLPWSLEFPITATAGIGSVAAQADSETVGCRITIDGEVKTEKTETHEVSTFISCLLKAA